jgi:hypothetical protein
MSEIDVFTTAEIAVSRDEEYVLRADHLAEVSRLERERDSLRRMTEDNRPKLMLEYNTFLKNFGPVPLSQSYGEKWLIDRLLAAQNFCDKAVQQLTKDRELLQKALEMVTVDPEHYLAEAALARRKRKASRTD